MKIDTTEKIEAIEPLFVQVRDELMLTPLNGGEPQRVKSFNATWVFFCDVREPLSRHKLTKLYGPRATGLLSDYAFKTKYERERIAKMRRPLKPHYNRRNASFWKRVALMPPGDWRDDVERMANALHDMEEWVLKALTQDSGVVG